MYCREVRNQSRRSCDISQICAVQHEPVRVQKDPVDGASGEVERQAENVARRVGPQSLYATVPAPVQMCELDAEWRAPV